jgi:RNA polymerase sigma factor (sigma-70 family)
MSHAVPATLSRLLPENDAPAEEAWGEFLAAHSKLILYVARSLGGDDDAVMDRYACILEQLQADNFRRLRTYSADGRSEFSTWLVVVAQRICLDHRRTRYGRFREADSASAERAEDWAARRRLVDLLSADVDLSSIRDNSSTDADQMVRVGELYNLLEAALIQLEPRDRLLVKLRFEDELPMPEISRSLGFPTRFHAYRQLTRVLADLRQALNANGVHDATA